MLLLLRTFALAVGLCAGVGSATAQDYEVGFEAFRAGNYTEASEIWRPLAESGDVRAQYGLGVLYERGSGDIATDLGKAAHWYARAVGQGHPSAQNNLGLMFAQGRGVERNPARAAELWRSAAEGGHLMAQYNLGLAYYRGEGLERDNRAALRWFRRAANNGLPDGQYAMGQMYRLGVVVEQDNGKALAWYRRAAEQGHTKARKQANRLAESGWKAASLETPPKPDRNSASGASSSPLPPDENRQVEPAERSASRNTGPANTGTADKAGGASIWLGSLRTKAKAREHWRDMMRRFPDALDGSSPHYAKVDLGDNGTYYRVLAGTFPDAKTARETCRALRARRASAFCKVMADNE